MVNDPWFIDPLTLVVRLSIALLLGGIIGFERERSNHAAGFRTHILVCIGSSLIMLLSIYGFSDFVDEENVRIDPSRLAAQVVSGIGFLGAGVILRNGFSVTGLTTAASLWVAAAIGLAVGAGFHLAAVTTTLFVLFSLLILNKVEEKWIHFKKNHIIKIETMDQPGILIKISEAMTTRKIKIRKITIEQNLLGTAAATDQEEIICILFSVRLPKHKILIPLIEHIRKIQGIREVSAE